MPTTVTTTTTTAAGATTTTTTTVTTAAKQSPIKCYHTMTGAPNPQIVDLAAAELGIDLKSVIKEVDLPGGENRNPEYLKMNPSGGLPFLELESGVFISETMAICELFEEMVEGTLIGSTPTERAQTRMWQRRVEQQIAIPMMNSFRWGSAKDFFAKRGHHGLCPSDAAAEQQMTVVKDQLKWLDGLMGDNEWVCGDRYSLADITLYGMVWFFCVTPGFGPPFPDLLKEELPWVWAWYRRVEARAATKACDAGYAERGPLKN